jgi:transcriptional regulator with XRE-family HTH domain
MDSGVPPGGVTAAVVGSRIRELRIRRAMTLRAVAEAVGVTATSVSFWETGRSYPRHETLAKLAQVLGTSMSYLLEGVGSAVDQTKFVNLAREQIARELGVDVSKVKVVIG